MKGLGRGLSVPVRFIVEMYSLFVTSRKFSASCGDIAGINFVPIVLL